MQNIHFRDYKNEQEITRMEFEVPVVCYCPLGLNYYKPILNIKIDLTDRIIDFLDLEKFFKEMLNGKHYTCEDLVKIVYETMKNIYKPKYLWVCCESDSHFKIKTIKEGRF